MQFLRTGLLSFLYCYVSFHKISFHSIDITVTVKIIILDVKYKYKEILQCRYNSENIRHRIFSSLKEIIRETWHYDEFSSPKTASKLAEVFLSSCLTNYTYSQVAILNAKVVGIILVKDIKAHRCTLYNRYRQIKSIIKLYLSSEGRKVSQIFKNVNGIDRQLLSSCQKTYPAELALFAVSSSCQGKGIGKQLFQSALDYMKSRNLEEFYLFTDTSCNYRFYEHQGMTRRCEKEHIFNINGQSAKMNFFIYDYQH